LIIAKKSLGQNFLIDTNIINKILDISKIKDENILEIGPGTGNLTSQILKRFPKKLTVIEKDGDLIKLLKNTFDQRINIIHSDVLKIDVNKLDKEKFTVFGNLPYNISTEILCKWIININDKNFWFNNLILMFQKEVADRIVSKYNSNNYGRLSILSNWKLKIKKVFDVKSTCFSPKPKVDSTVLIFEPKKNFLRIKDAKNLEHITKIFFMHRRKMIKKPYNLLFNGKMDVAKKLNIELSCRPQHIDFETYYKIAREYENLRS